MLHFGEVRFEPVERRDHVSHLVKFGNDGGLNKLKTTKRRTCVSEQEELVDHLHEREDYFLFIISAPSDKIRIGTCEIYDVDWVARTCRACIWMTDRAENIPAFGSQATNILGNYIFKTIGLQKLSIDVVTEDVVMMALYKNHGFHQELRKRNHLYLRGKYKTIVEFGLLSEEFEIKT